MLLKGSIRIKELERQNTSVKKGLGTNEKKIEDTGKVRDQGNQENFQTLIR